MYGALKIGHREIFPLAKEPSGIPRPPFLKWASLGTGYLYIAPGYTQIDIGIQIHVCLELRVQEREIYTRRLAIRIYTSVYRSMCIDFRVLSSGYTEPTTLAIASGERVG